MYNGSKIAQMSEIAQNDKIFCLRNFLRFLVDLKYSYVLDGGKGIKEANIVGHIKAAF